MSRWLVLTAGLCLFSCDSKQPATTPPSDTAGEVPAAEPPAAASEESGAKPKWTEMTHEQKEAHMDEVIVPAMATKFQGWRADEFKEFGCATCHGAGANEGKFEMPNPDLPKLPKWGEMEKNQPEVVKFMTEVEVEMAAMLDLPVYDPKTHKGFSCGNCHLWQDNH